MRGAYVLVVPPFLALILLFAVIGGPKKRAAVIESKLTPPMVVVHRAVWHSREWRDEQPDSSGWISVSGYKYARLRINRIGADPTGVSVDVVLTKEMP